jgi:hypothetical protein
MSIEGTKRQRCWQSSNKTRPRVVASEILDDGAAIIKELEDRGAVINI